MHDMAAVLATAGTNTDELLSMNPEDAMMAVQCMLEELRMKSKREEILKNHPYNRKFNEKKGRWYTRFKVDGKIIQRHRATEEELKDLIVSFYENGGCLAPDDDEDIAIYSFEKAHDRWLEMQQEYGKDDNTIYKYEADWKRFFADTDFAKHDIAHITSQEIELFMINTIKRLNLKRQAGVTLFGYITGVYYNAVMDRRIEPGDNPCNLVDKKKFKRFYNTDEKTPEQRTMSPENVTDLINRLNSDLEKNECCLSAYAAKLSLLTGMRSGEICGLRWENVHLDDRYFCICETEKYNSKEKYYYMSTTKNKMKRNFEITPGLRKFFETMMELQKRHGCFNGFVISTGTEKVRTRKLSDYMIKRSKSLGFDISKNIHTIRRTFNSYMRSDGVSAVTAGSIIGNSAQVNEINYTYDMAERNKKCDTIQSAQSKILGDIALF